MVDNDNFKEYMLQADSLMGLEKYEEALKYYSKAEAVDMMNIEVHMSKGIAYANLEKYEDAKKEFEKTIKINRTCGIAYFHMGNVEILLDNKSRGIELYNNAIANGYDNAQVYYSLGLMYEEEGNYDLAIRNYSKAIMKDHNRPDIRVKKIRLLIENGNLELALNDLNALILSNPDIFEGYHLKYIVLEELGRIEEAQATIDEAMEMFPEDPAFALDNASLMLNNKKYTEALAYLNDISKKVELEPEFLREIEIKKSRVYAGLRDLNSMCGCLKRAKDISKSADPEGEDAEVVYFLMTCYVGLEDFNNAYNEAKELKQMKEENFFTLAGHYFEPFTLRQLGKEAQALALYEDAVDYYRNRSLKNPGNVDAYVYRAMVLRELGDYDKALELADYLVSLYDSLSEIHVLRATVLEKMGNEEEAKIEREKAKGLTKILAD